MKVLLGVTAILAVAVLGLGWQLKLTWGDAEVARGEASAASQVAKEQREQAESILSRLEQFDGALTRMAEKTEEVSQLLGAAMNKIDQIQKTEGDSDESIACLDVPVPAQLDGVLR